VVEASKLESTLPIETTTNDTPIPPLEERLFKRSNHTYHTLADMDPHYLPPSDRPTMTSKIGILHKGDKPIWECVARWTNHLASVANSKGHSHIRLVRSSCNLKGEYTEGEADAYSTADIPLGQEAWDPYLRNTVNSHRGDGAYTEIIVISAYNIWAMLRYPMGIDTTADCITQDHAHLLSVANLEIRILAQRRWGYEILSGAVGSSLNDNPDRVKEEIIKRARQANIPLDDKQFDISSPHGDSRSCHWLALSATIIRPI